MRDALFNFLRTGVLGPTRLGMSAALLQNVLGEPDDIAMSEPLWLYGVQGAVHLQLLLRDDSVQGIWLYFWEQNDCSTLPNQLAAAAWKMDGRTTIDKFKQLMTSEKIQWSTNNRLTFDDQTFLETDAGV